MKWLLLILLFTANLSSQVNVELQNKSIHLQPPPLNLYEHNVIFKFENLITLNYNATLSNTSVQPNQNYFVELKPLHQDGLWQFLGINNDMVAYQIMEPSGTSIPLAKNSTYSITIKNEKESDSSKIIFSFPLSIDQSYIPPPGLYTTRWLADLYDEQMQLLDQSEIFLDFTLSAFASLDFLGAGTKNGRTTLDFGSISSEQTRRLYLQVHSNCSPKISIASKNNFRLEFDGDKNANVTYRPIEYTLKIGNKFITQSSSYQVSTQDFKQSSNLSVIPLEVTVYPDVKKHWSGSYSDHIIFEIETLL